MADTYLAPLHIYKPPNVSTAAEFEAKYGEKLWETDEASYDYLVKGRAHPLQSLAGSLARPLDYVFDR
jgi:hypothetical protein